MAGKWRVKTVENSIRETDEPGHQLKRNLKTWDLIVFGVGVIVGTGIFVLTGQQAALNAGPAVVLSFLLAGITCAFAALCYAELASTVPVAGSAYTFAYATLGEVVAWIIGWDLLLELMLGAAVVARGWSAYLQSLLGLPTWLAGDKAWPDPAAIAIVLVLSLLLVRGSKTASRFTGVLVAVKIAVVLVVIVVGAMHINTANYTPFIPPSEPVQGAEGGILHQPIVQAFLGLEPSAFGVFGVVAATSVVFFAFIGFDIVATTAEETANPQRDMPRAILGSLAICTVLYMAVAAVLTGMVPYGELNTGAPLAEAFDSVGITWAARVIALGRRRDHHGDLGDAHGADPGAVRDVPRQPPAASTGQGPPPVRDAVAHHGHRRGRGGDPRGSCPALGAVRTREHRHAVRLRGRLCRCARAAPHPARSSPRVPHPRGPRGADPRGRGVRVAHDQLAAGDLAALPGLDGHRHRDLPGVRPSPQQARV